MKATRKKSTYSKRFITTHRAYKEKEAVEKQPLLHLFIGAIHTLRALALSLQSSLQHLPDRYAIV